MSNELPHREDRVQWLYGQPRARGNDWVRLNGPPTTMAHTGCGPANDMPPHSSDRVRLPVQDGPAPLLRLATTDEEADGPERIGRMLPNLTLVCVPMFVLRQAPTSASMILPTSSS